MEAVFKYCDDRGVRILENLELKITPPNQFNDPFEFRPRVTCSSANRRFKNLLRDKNELRRMFLAQKSEGFRGDFREFKKQLRKIRPTIVKALVPRMPEVNTELQTTYPERVSADHGVLCMSARKDSIVMWGHYCDKHRGMVIGFDRSWNMFGAVQGLRAVEYVRERVQWDTSWVPGGSKETAFLAQLIFSKNDEWKYEGELRQLFTLGSLPSRTVEDGSRGYFLPIPAQIVVSVSLGMRCSAALEKAVRSALDNPHLRHVRLDRARLHDNDFALEFEPA
jgi:Protein of unknown function (DUF2971)